MKLRSILYIVTFVCTRQNFCAQHPFPTQQAAPKRQKMVRRQEIDRSLNDLLLTAAKNGDLQAINKLFAGETIPDVNAKGDYGSTPLINAAIKGHTTIAQALIAAGADVNAANNSGRTALFWAVRNGHKDVVQLLISAGADINAQDNDYSYTALMQAALYGHKDIMLLLIAAGADINVKNKARQTARYYALDKVAAYDQAVEAARKAYVARQAKAKKIIAEEKQLIPVISDIIAGYAYGPSPADLPATQEEEKKEADKN